MQIPINSLDQETLLRVIEEFVTREGTDYGANRADLHTKVQQVLGQLQRGEALLFFDPESESCQIASKYDQRYTRSQTAASPEPDSL